MNGKQVVVLLALAATLAFVLNQNSASRAPEFEAWKTKFSVKFNSEMENAYREKIFLENLAKMHAHNSDEFRTYSMGINQFSALTEEEFISTYLGYIPQSDNVVEEDGTDVHLGDVDWMSQGAVTPIKNQGQCGSCWAFSTTGGLEGLSKLAYGELKSFSESQLVDCSSSYGNKGCQGGLMDNAFKFVKAKGIVTEEEYPYEAKQNKCKIPGGPFKISGFTDIKTCNALATALNERPVSVAVDASKWSTYKGGVFSTCGTQLNHGVLLVGATEKEWKVKNSWGTTWGENGTIRLARGNTCGICNVASYPNK